MGGGFEEADGFLAAAGFGGGEGTAFEAGGGVGVGG